MTKSTLYDPEFDVDSRSALKPMLGFRNLELQLRIETAGQASQLDTPTRPDPTEPIFELATKFLPRKPKLVRGPAPYGENEAKWLNSFFI